MRDFKECLTRSFLTDLHFCGNNFIWSNNSISKKLELFLINDECMRSFPDPIGVFGEPGISDHSPFCVFIDQFKPKQKTPFKFYSHLNLHENFSDLTKSCWNDI